MSELVISLQTLHSQNTEMQKNADLRPKLGLNAPKTHDLRKLSKHTLTILLQLLKR